VALDKQAILALSSFLRRGPWEFETPVRGRSMGRDLPEGSQIRVRFATDNQLRAVQIVVYVSKYGVVAHRLVRRVTSRGISFLIT
jgi:hypothetical protein